MGKGRGAFVLAIMLTGAAVFGAACVGGGKEGGENAGASGDQSVEVALETAGLRIEGMT